MNGQFISVKVYGINSVKNTTYKFHTKITFSAVLISYLLSFLSQFLRSFILSSPAYVSVTLYQPP